MNVAAIMRALSTPPDATWEIKVHTQTEGNPNGHWRPKQKRAKKQRAIAHLATRCLFRPIRKPVVVKMTRVAPSDGLDDDNLASALKHVRDGIADAFGCGDGVKDGIEWMRDQIKDEHYAVKVSVWL